MDALLRIKVRVQNKGASYGRADQPAADNESWQLTAVEGEASEEDKEFAKVIASGSVNLTLRGDAVGKLGAGREFYVDFIPVK